jgi:nascent polypeptide-associated complex subunit alpha
MRLLLVLKQFFCAELLFLIVLIELVLLEVVNMFPGGVNPKQMAGMMRQFGIKNQEIDAKEVVITLKNGKKIKIVEPQVQSIEMKGIKTYSLAGREVIEEEYSKEDVSMVAEQTGVSEEEAKKALIETKGDIAQAILKLKE